MRAVEAARNPIIRPMPAFVRTRPTARPKLNLLKSSRSFQARRRSVAPPAPSGTARSWRGIVPFTHLAREGRMTVTLGRRELLVALGGAVAAWPLAAHAQQTERLRRIGVLMHLGADDPEGQRRVAAFLQGLQEVGWEIGRNVDIDVRWAAGEADRFPRYAAELIALAPDVILASATPSARAVRQATRMVPIVFVLVPDAAGRGQFGAIQGAAPSFGVEIIPIAVDDAETIERGITAFARTPNGGLIVVALPTTTMHRELIVKLAASHQLPAVYPSRVHAAGGGPVSFGSDTLNEYR